MSRLVLLALFANAVAVVVREDAAPKLTSFEMGCYYAEDPSYHADRPPSEKGGAKGRSYRGLVSYTVSGRTCKNWLSDNPWKGAGQTATPDVEEGGIMKWGNGLGNHNYCRNPDGAEGFDKPWCFTLDPKVPKEACNIEQCPDKQPEYVNIAEKLGKTMRSGMSVPGCKCADQLFGSTVTTEDTSVKFLQNTRMGRTKDGKPCTCRH